MLIETTDALAAFCDKLAFAEYITVDTEFMREKTFWPKLCLVQVAGPDEAFCIDPLAEGIDLSPLYAVLENPKVLKVFHAARQDLEIFLCKTGRIPAPLFDTQVAAMVCGFGDSVGYETLAAKLAGARIDKSQRFTDWSHRPLSDKQVHYALADVTHLRTAYEQLKGKLEKSGRSHWLEEEMTILTSPDTYRTHPEESWKRLKHRSKSRRFLGILKEVAAWRESEAQTKDVPRQRVIRDEAILEIAALAPKSIEELGRSRTFPKGAANGRYGQEIIEAVKRGKAIPEDQCPPLPDHNHMPPGLGPVVDLLRVLLKVKCEAQDVAQRLVASGDDLDRIAADDQADVPALHGWRKDIFGEDALKLKHGQLALTYLPEQKQIHIVRHFNGN